MYVIYIYVYASDVSIIYKYTPQNTFTCMHTTLYIYAYTHFKVEPLLAPSESLHSHIDRLLAESGGAAASVEPPAGLKLNMPKEEASAASSLRLSASEEARANSFY